MAQNILSIDQLDLETWGHIYSFCSGLGDSQKNPQFGDAVHLTKSPLEILTKDKSTTSLDSDELLRNYGSGFTKSGEKSKNQGDETDGSKKLSTQETMRMAGERYIDLTSQGIDINSIFTPPYSSSLSDLSLEEQQNVELTHLLLIAAEKVGNHQHDQASKFLIRCDWLASATGNSVQRVVYYFTKALRERIHMETGVAISRRAKEMQNNNLSHLAMSTNLVFLKFHQVFPFNQVITFAGIETILKQVKKSTKIHLIDLQIRSGVHWATFMQAISERVSNPVKHLKITAIGTTDMEKIVETGKNLESFAKSLNLNFSYRIIFLSDINKLQEEHFMKKSHEAVVVYCPLILRTMVFRPYCLQNLMKVIKLLNPCIVVVIEVEANHNSPSFFHRFIEALFFYSAYFDCLDECTDRENNYRNILEKVYLGDGVENIVATEGMDRVTRSMPMSAWGTFFQKFGMVKMELCESSIYQANMTLKQFACASSCNVDYREKSLTVGWKGTPIQSLSTWKFY